MTEHYLVLLVWPAMLSVLRLALVGSPSPAMSWRPEKGALLYVIDRRKGGGGHVATYK
jgi:carotenoid cleavage dioxygenase-like enzyme